MTLRRTLAGIAASLSLIAAASAAAIPAQAATSDCGTGKACLWVTRDYVGLPDGWFYQSLSTLGNLNDRALSIANYGRTSIAGFYEHSNFGGKVIFLNNPARGGQWRDPSLRNGTDASNENWANRISSARFV